MKKQTIRWLLAITFCVSAPAYSGPDPLPSWNEGVSKTNIIAFVKQVTTEADPGFVSPGQRIATFDNDGTLWSEQPMYFQLIFALDRVRPVGASPRLFRFSAWLPPSAPASHPGFLP